jgi:hypothetical protein
VTNDSLIRRDEVASVVDDESVRRALRELTSANPKGQQHEARWSTSTKDESLFSLQVSGPLASNEKAERVDDADTFRCGYAAGFEIVAEQQVGA